MTDIATTADAIRRLMYRIDIRLDAALCDMEPGRDDSITGFNEAWDLVRKIFEEELRK